MSKKEKLIKVFEKGITDGYDYIAVLVETRGSKGKELIINPHENFEDKLTYYDKAYNDDLVLNTYNGIKIVSASVIGNLSDVLGILEQLDRERF